MSEHIRKADYFIDDFDRRFRWFDRKAGWDVACRFLEAVDATLERAGENPLLGHILRFHDPSLNNVRWIAVAKPFQKHLVFYRIELDGIEAWRLLHGAQNLTVRLFQPPGYEDEDFE